MRHLLLPDCYQDAATHAIILFSLAPYDRIKDSGDPHFRWDLQRAWLDAKPLLKSAHWQYNSGKAEDAADAGWELAGDTDEEIKGMHTIIAGILAHQIENADSPLSLRRIEARKGGEMALIISNQVQEQLRILFPEARYEGFTVEAALRRAT